MAGVAHASRTRMLATFNADFGRSVFLMPIAERRRRLLAVDWVEDASIARIWPNQIAVRIQERKPVAFVNIPAPHGRGARVMLIDAEGVLLEPPRPIALHVPVLAGITEDQAEPERRQRVQAMLGLLDDLGALGKDISEVNAADSQNLIIVTRVEGRALELVMGNQNFAARMQNFWTTIPKSGGIRRTCARSIFGSTTALRRGHANHEPESVPRRRHRYRQQPHASGGVHGRR